MSKTTSGQGLRTAIVVAAATSAGAGLMAPQPCGPFTGIEGTHGSTCAHSH